MSDTYQVLGTSLAIKVTVEVLDDGEIELESIEGRSEVLEGDRISDVQWFENMYNEEGPLYLLFGDEKPDPGIYWMKGQMIADRIWTDYGWEHDCRFEINEHGKIE